MCNRAIDYGHHALLTSIERTFLNPPSGVSVVVARVSTISSGGEKKGTTAVLSVETNKSSIIF